MNSLTKSLFALGSTLVITSANRVLKNLTAEDVLSLVGVARRRAVLPSGWSTVGMVAVGAAAGASVALLLAPRSGQELRARLADRLDEARDRMEARASSSRSAAGRPAHS